MATVIPFPTPPAPRLREIVGGNGKGVISSWLSAHSGARARFRIRVQNLRRTPRVDWSIKQYRNIGHGLGEFKWESGKKQFRIACVERDGYFVMLLGFTHKQGVYEPHDWLKTAKRRKEEVQRGEWRTIDFEP